MKVLVHYETSTPLEYEFNRDLPLTSHLDSLCLQFGIPGDRERFSLVIKATDYHLTQKDLGPHFELEHGTDLVIKLRPTFEVGKCLEGLRNRDKRTIFELRKQLKDQGFAHEFLRKGGISVLNQLVMETQGNTLAYSLSALETSMSFGFGWESPSDAFIENLFRLVDSSNLNVCKSSLEIAVHLINSPSDGLFRIAPAIEALGRDGKPYGLLVKTLSSTDLDIQLHSFRMINSILGSVSQPQERWRLYSAIHSSGVNPVLRKLSVVENPELKKQIHRYQWHRFSIAKKEQQISYDKQNPEHEALLMKLWKLTFPGEKISSRVCNDWKKIGFQGQDPATDFRGMGLYGLKTLIYFAEHYNELWRKIVSEQASRQGDREYPVAVAGINISQMLLECLAITEEETAETVIHPVIFDGVDALEEMYCISFQLLDKTWDEMEATYMTFPYVLAAVKKRVSEVLEQHPATIVSFERATIGKFKAQVWEEKEEPAQVSKLRSKIQEEMTELVKQTKILTMKEGSNFKLYTPVVDPKKKQVQFIHLRLTENCDAIMYGVSETGSTETASMKLDQHLSLQVGVYAANLPKNKKLEDSIAGSLFSLSVKGNPNETFLCLATSRFDFVTWVDGIRLVQGGKPECPETLTELKVLSDSEMEVKLLDLEPLTLPSDPPSIPPPPADYAFVVNDLQDETSSVQPSSKAAPRGFLSRQRV